MTDRLNQPDNPAANPARSPLWLELRSKEWRDIEESLPKLGDNQPIEIEEIDRAMHSYPELARDLAIAQRTAANSKLAAYLATLYAGLYRSLFRAPKYSKDDLKYFFKREIPDLVYQLRWQIVSVAMGFVLTTLAGWFLITEFPDLVTLFASQAMIDKVQAGELWTDGLLNIVPSSILSVQIFTNNILVALTTLSLGALYGLGTIYIISLNGLMLGGIFAFVAAYGMDDQLLKFVMAHGPVELSVIILAGAIGFSIGESLARPGQQSRRSAFQKAATNGAKLMFVCVLFLLGAGLIEGYISPNDSFDFTFRALVGWGYWLIFVGVLLGIPRSRRAEDKT